MEGLCYLITTKLKEQEKWVKEALQDLRNIGGMELGIFESNEGKVYEGENLSNTEKTARWKTSGDWARAFNLFWEVFSEKYATYNAGGPSPRGAQGDLLGRSRF